MSTGFVIEVLGTPAAKGSPHARVQNGHVVMHEGTKTKGWERAVREAAIAAIGTPGVPPFVDVALRVAVTFRLVRPGGHWGKKGLKPSAPAYPHKKPDVDKLLRATLDPLIGAVMDDDSRIVYVTANKVYADPGNEGATIHVERAS